jgi:hypothetical protein|tara:strand:+ start:215 stop:1291 length:1077 start_codon:yes stop_codon:yes gene_type:complete
MAYTTIDDPTLHFSCTIYTGNAADDRAVTIDGTGMAPDLLWIKNRDEAEHGKLGDTVRGINEVLVPSDTDSASSSSSYTNISSATSDGFTVSKGGVDGAVNKNSIKYVAWSWLAGSAFTNDASSTSVGSIDSAGQVNAAAGFSIQTYTGTGSAGTVAHGLSSTPTFWMTKATSETRAWYGWHNKIALGDVVNLNSTNAAQTDTSLFSTTAPSSSVYSIGASVGTNKNTIAFVNYLFHDVQGYSKFGTYEGDTDANGPVVWLGFEPAFLMVKPVDSADNWVLFDNKRNAGAVVGSNSPYFVYANTSGAETTDTRLINFTSTGFKIKASGNTINRASTFIYLAFAQQPFVNSNGVPATAR